MIAKYSPMFTAACSLDVLVKLLLQVVLELGSEVRRVEKDRVGEFTL